MTNESPIINKSCGIIPNRPCLVIFAVLKIIADFTASVILGYISLMIITIMSDCLSQYLYLTIMLGIVLDIPFMIVLIIGACKNSNHLYKISFYYSILSLVIALAYIFLFIVLTYMVEYYDIGKDMYGTDLSDLENLLIHIAIVTAYTLIHIYMILLIRSEFTKTKSYGHIYNEQESIVKRIIKQAGEPSYDRF